MEVSVSFTLNVKITSYCAFRVNYIGKPTDLPYRIKAKYCERVNSEPLFAQGEYAQLNIRPI